MYEDTRSWCWWLRWETVQRLCGLVCISRERYTAGVWRAYRKVYRGIQKGIQGGGGEINIQWRGPLYVPQKNRTQQSRRRWWDLKSAFLIFKNKALIQILNKQKGKNTKCIILTNCKQVALFKSVKSLLEKSILLQIIRDMVCKARDDFNCRQKFMLLRQSNYLFTVLFETLPLRLAIFNFLQCFVIIWWNSENV